MAGTSRVNREVYARFCGRLAVKFHRPTRLIGWLRNTSYYLFGSGSSGLGNNALVTGLSIDAVHGLGELAHRIHEQAEVLTSADLYRVMAGIAIALFFVIPVLPVRIYPPWCTTPPSSR